MTLSDHLLCIAVAALLAGCSKPPDDDSGEPSGDPERVVDELAAAQCAKLFECCSEEDRSDVFGAVEVGDEAECRDALRSQADAFFRPALDRSIEAEAVAVDEGALETCAAALDERSCAQFEPAVSVDVLSVDGCRAVVEPQLASSAFCAEDYECRSGFCSRPPAESEGSCKQPPEVDDPCLNDRCGDGLYCTMDDVCAEKLGAGDVCTRNTDCQSESCEPGDDGEFVCTEPPQLCTG